MLAMMWEKWSPHSLLKGMQTGQATTENGVEIPQKGTAIKCNHSTSEHIPKHCIYYCQDTCSFTLIFALCNQCKFLPTGARGTCT